MSTVISPAVGAPGPVRGPATDRRHHSGRDHGPVPSLPPSARIHCPTRRFPFAASLAGWASPFTRRSASCVVTSWPTTVPGARAPLASTTVTAVAPSIARCAGNHLAVAHAHARYPAGAGRGADENAHHTGARDGCEARRRVGISGILGRLRDPARVRRVAQQARGRQDQDHRQGPDHPGADAGNVAGVVRAG